MLEDISIQFSRGQFYLVTTDDLIFVDSLHLTEYLSLTHEVLSARLRVVSLLHRSHVTSTVSHNDDQLVTAHPWRC